MTAIPALSRLRRASNDEVLVERLAPPYTPITWPGGALEPLTDVYAEIVDTDGAVHRTPTYRTPDHIGVPGALGFGVASYPGALPAGFSALPGSELVGSDEYGNYVYGRSQSVMVWIPRFYYRITHDVAAPYYGTRVEIRSDAAPGFALHRAFIDGGEVKAGFFVDKYLWSNAAPDGTDNTGLAGGVAASVSHRRPVSTHPDNNPLALLTSGGVAPANNYGGVYAASKTRGPDFAPISRFCYSALAMLSLAHAQAQPGLETAAWMDVAPYAPKGCTNNALGDNQDREVRYTHSGYTDAGGVAINQPLTGSGTPFAKTTHNGQASGVADLNGSMYEVNSGFTNVGGAADTYYILRESVRLRDLIDSTSAPNGAFAVGPHERMAPVWWEHLSAWTYYGNGTNLVLDPAIDRAAPGYQLTALGLPRGAAAVGSQVATNGFGGDGFYQFHRSLLAPIAGGDWSTGSTAGVWALRGGLTRSHSGTYVGSRSVLYV